MGTIECEWFTTEEKRHPEVPEGSRGHTMCLVNRKRGGLERWHSRDGNREP